MKTRHLFAVGVGTILSVASVPIDASGQGLFPPRESHAPRETLSSVLGAALWHALGSDMKLGVYAAFPDSSRHEGPEGPVAIDVGASVNQEALGVAVRMLLFPVRDRLESLRCVRPRVDCVFEGVSAILTVFGVAVEGDTAEVVIRVDSYYLMRQRDSSFAGRRRQPS